MKNENEQKKFNGKKIFQSVGFVLLAIFLILLIVFSCIGIKQNRDNFNCNVAYANAPTYTNLTLTFDDVGVILTEEQAFNYAFILDGYVGTDGVSYNDNTNCYRFPCAIPLENNEVAFAYELSPEGEMISILPYSLTGLEEGQYLLSVSNDNLAIWLSTHSYIKNNPLNNRIFELEHDISVLQERLTAAISANTAYQNQINAMTKQINDFENNERILNNQISDLSAQISDLQLQIPASYNRGFADGTANATAPTTAIDFIGNIFHSIGSFLDIELFNGFTLGALFAIPLICALVFAILKIVRG